MERDKLAKLVHRQTQSWLDRSLERKNNIDREIYRQTRKQKRRNVEKEMERGKRNGKRTMEMERGKGNGKRKMEMERITILTFSLVMSNPRIIMLRFARTPHVVGMP